MSIFTKKIKILGGLITIEEESPPTKKSKPPGDLTSTPFSPTKKVTVIKEPITKGDKCRWCKGTGNTKGFYGHLVPCDMCDGVGERHIRTTIEVVRIIEEEKH